MARRLLGALGVFRATDEKTAMEAARAHLLAFSMGSFALWLTGELACWVCADGSDPVGLVQGTDGNFYGSTVTGGTQHLCFRIHY